MDGRAPNIRHLRAIREVARHQSILGASAVVHLSQPAITQAIAKLEADLDVQLFERRSEGMFVTEPGKLFVERVERTLGYLEAGARETARIGQRKRGRGFANLDDLVTGVQLRALAAISRSENFSLAARSVGISQPSLHRAARDLERLSGMALFEKSGHGIALTRAAQVLAQHAKLAFAELEQGIAAIEEWKGTASGRIVIGTMPLARTFILPTAIMALMKVRPEVRISVVDGPYDDLLHGLRHGDLDLLIGALRDPIPVDDVVQASLLEDNLCIAARAGHPLAAKRKIKPVQLAAFPWIVPRSATPTRNHFEALFEAETQPVNVIEASSLVLIRGLLLGSDALALISAHQIRHEEEFGQLTRLRFDTADTKRQIGLTLRRDWRPTETQKQFLDILKATGKAASCG